MIVKEAPISTPTGRIAGRWRRMKDRERGIQDNDSNELGAAGKSEGKHKSWGQGAGNPNQVEGENKRKELDFGEGRQRTREEAKPSKKAKGEGVETNQVA